MDVIENFGFRNFIEDRTLTHLDLRVMHVLDWAFFPYIRIHPHSERAQKRVCERSWAERGNVVESEVGGVPAAFEWEGGENMRIPCLRVSFECRSLGLTSRMITL